MDEFECRSLKKKKKKENKTNRQKNNVCTSYVFFLIRVHANKTLQNYKKTPTVCRVRKSTEENSKTGDIKLGFQHASGTCRVRDIVLNSKAALPSMDIPEGKRCNRIPALAREVQVESGRQRARRHTGYHVQETSTNSQ